MSFIAHLKEGDVFTKIVDSIKELTPECNFDCSANGVTAQSMDNSHVALVKLELNKDGFEEYRCKEDISLGLNLTNLAKVMKCAGAKDSLQIEAEDSENISFSFTNPEENKCSNFKLKLFDIDTEHLGIPSTDYDCSVTMSSTEFSKICRDLTVLGDAVKISASKAGVQFQTKGDIGNADLLYKSSTEGEEQSVKVKVSDDLTQCFALRYLAMFSKSGILSNQVTLNMAEGIPLMVEYKIGDLGEIKYFLAPKVDDEE